MKVVRTNLSPNSIKSFNSVLRGFHNYYSVATNCYLDFALLEFKLLRPMQRLLKSIPGVSKSSPLLAISDVAHKNLLNFSQNLNIYNPKGREVIHRSLDTGIRTYLQGVLSSSDDNATIEYNDNRISKWSIQKGKCAVTKQFLGLQFVCHHITPRYLGGSDRFDNLLIISSDVHSLLHATIDSTINKYLDILNLPKKQIAHVNSLRKQAKLGPLGGIK